MEAEKLTVLIAEDQKINRQILRRLLSSEYEVFEAENGREAFAQLKQHPDISAILLDIIMPVMDGYEFLRLFRASEYSSLPIIAITSEKDEISEQKALEFGAWDFVSKPYQPATLLTRLKNVITRSQYYLVTQIKYVYEHDPLTGLLNHNAFFIRMRKLLDEHPDQTFAIVRLDIDHFQTYNSFWGEEKGNDLLCFLAKWMRKSATYSQPCVYGRINADAFCICMPHCEALIRSGAKQAFDMLAKYNSEYRLVPSFGVYVIENPGENVRKMYEFAALAARECKEKYLSYLCYYQPEMSDRVLEKQWIVNQMQKALDRNEFEVYLQPKYNLHTDQPFGAEALVRWRHPERGLLSPGLFIPVFEQNGFIGKVDFFVWEQVCILLHRWILQGTSPAPISVNVSRVNLYNSNLVSLLTELVRKYDLRTELLHLEITESAYMENPNVLETTIGRLQREGFTILMDDFGSGYSSLNTLKDIPVNMLKIDMKFLSGNSSSERSRSILASSVRMAGWLGMPVIMEGVETEEQVRFLKGIGCNYAQGYYYAKPMSVSDYEALISGRQQIPAVTPLERLEDISGLLWGNDLRSELLFHSLAEPAAVFEYSDGAARALRVNASFNRRFGVSFCFDRYSGKSEPSGLFAAEQERILRAFQTAAETREPVPCLCTIPSSDKTGVSVRLMLRYWGMNGTSAILFAQFFRTEPARTAGI